MQRRYFWDISPFLADILHRLSMASHWTQPFFTGENQYSLIFLQVFLRHLALATAATLRGAPVTNTVFVSTLYNSLKRSCLRPLKNRRTFDMH